MPKNVSNLHGRSFEYTITNELSRLPGATLTPRAQADQARDAANFQLLPRDLAEHFRNGARCIFHNLHSLLPNGVISNNVIIDRLPDIAGMAAQSNVTDIQLSFPNYRLNLSVKNNHSALKHPRPSALMQQLGIRKESQDDKEYRTGLREVYATFDQEARDFYKQETGEAISRNTNFRDLTAYDEGFIDNHLYNPVCDFVCQKLQRELANPEMCRHYFFFLVGKINFYKLILKNDSVVVEKYNEVPAPTSCIVQRQAHSYILLFFSNGWQLSLRLHTASLAIGNTPSLKFDTQHYHCDSEEIGVDGFTIPTENWPLYQTGNRPL